MRIYLEFSPKHRDIERARLGYAFSLFCAIHGHQRVPIDQQASADVRITYSTADHALASTPALRLSDLYEARPISQPAPPPSKFACDGESTVLLYTPLPTSEPDWLAEIFEWVSCADEYSIQRRDSRGRIDFRDSYAGRHKLDVGVPYAAVAMLFLRRALYRAVGQAPDSSFACATGDHFVINTHDVDILPAGYFGSLQRLAKYALISLLVFKSAQSAASQAAKALSMAVGGRNPLDQTPRLVEAERQNGVGASYFFIAGRGHRRDANYAIDDPAVRQLMQSVERNGMEVALHGSYTSLDRPGGLDAEFKLLRGQQFEPRGNRQHWLRFTLDRLIPEVEKTGALYDCSLGWDGMGFRAGACFAFPPYNFQFERAATFLEIPLAIMEQAFVTEGAPRDNWFNDAARILANSRRYGWGGISLLWHPTAFGGSQLPSEVERVFWKLVGDSKQHGDKWMSCLDFVRTVAGRYVEAGLLPTAFGGDARETFVPTARLDGVQHRAGHPRQTDQTTLQPLVSMIVLCRDEKDSIAECLDSLISNDYPKDRIEILVADGMSQDGTRAIVESYANTHPFLTLVDNPNKIPAAAANEGIRAAKGDVIMIAGAHAVYPKDYISKCVSYSQKYPDADNIGGVRCTKPRNKTLIGKTIAYVSSHRLGAGTAGYHRTDGSPTWVESVWGGCFRKEVFEKYGLYNEALVIGEDRDFNRRIRDSGGKILQVPEIECTYYARSKLLAYCRWAFRMGFWPFHAEKLAGRRLVSFRNYVPLAFVATLLLAIGAALSTSAGWYLLGGILSVYALACVASAVALATREKDPRYFFVAPFVFGLTHIPYGLGSIYGILKRVSPVRKQLRNSEGTLPV